MKLIKKPTGKEKAEAQKKMLEFQQEQKRQAELLAKPTELQDEKCTECGSVVWNQAYVLKQIPPKDDKGIPMPVPKPVMLCAHCGQLHPSATAFMRPDNCQK